MRYFALALGIACVGSPKFPGTYTLVGYAKPGTHEAGSIPRTLKGSVLTLREDGSVTMRTPGTDAQEAEYIVAADSSAFIVTSDGPFILRGRFSHDTLLTRVPGGGPIFYWKRT